MADMLGSRWLKAVVVGLAAITYNNWALGSWLNPLLSKNNGSISEFSISGQPHYLVFRILDVLSGILLIATAALFVKNLDGSRPGRFILAVTAVMGIANIADALITLPCSVTLSSTCSIPVRISFSHYQMPAHAYSSIALAVCYFLLPLAGLVYGLRQKHRLSIAVSALTLGSALYSLGSALGHYIHIHSFTVRASGGGQEAEMIILVVWLVVFYLSVKPTPLVLNKAEAKHVS